MTYENPHWFVTTNTDRVGLHAFKITSACECIKAGPRIALLGGVDARAGLAVRCGAKEGLIYEAEPFSEAYPNRRCTENKKSVPGFADKY